MKHQCQTRRRLYMLKPHSTVDSLTVLAYWKSFRFETSFISDQLSLVGSQGLWDISIDALPGTVDDYNFCFKIERWNTGVAWTTSSFSPLSELARAGMGILFPSFKSQTMTYHASDINILKAHQYWWPMWLWYQMMNYTMDTQACAARWAFHQNYYCLTFSRLVHAFPAECPSQFMSCSWHIPPGHSRPGRIVSSCTCAAHINASSFATSSQVKTMWDQWQIELSLLLCCIAYALHMQMYENLIGRSQMYEVPLPMLRPGWIRNCLYYLWPGVSILRSVKICLTCSVLLKHWTDGYRSESIGFWIVICQKADVLTCLQTMTTTAATHAEGVASAWKLLCMV